MKATSRRRHREAKAGQVKVDLVRALKSRLYGFTKQTDPLEVPFRQTTRDLKRAMDEVNQDATGSILESIRLTLEKQVSRATEKAVERLQFINPELSTLDQVMDLEGNPPKRSKEVPSADVPPEGGDSSRSDGLSGFETVTGTGPEDARPLGRSHLAQGPESHEPVASTSHEPPTTRRDNKESETRPEGSGHRMETRSKGKSSKKQGPKNPQFKGNKAEGRPEGGMDQELEEEIRKTEARLRQLRGEFRRGSPAPATTEGTRITQVPGQPVGRGGKGRGLRNGLANNAMPDATDQAFRHGPGVGYEPSVASFRGEKKGHKKKGRSKEPNAGSAATSTPSHGRSSMSRRRYGEETQGHLGDVDDSEEEDEAAIDWEARVAKRNSLAGLKFPKGWEIPPAHIVRRHFRHVDFAKEMKRGLFGHFWGPWETFPGFVTCSMKMCKYRKPPYLPNVKPWTPYFPIR